MTVKQWLHVNTRQLMTYKMDEIVRVAVACGFDFKEVCHELLYWFDGVAIEGCATDLYEEWVNLRMYEYGGWEYEEEAV